MSASGMPTRIDITLWPRSGVARVHEHQLVDGSDEPKEWSEFERVVVIDTLMALVNNGTDLYVRRENG